MSSEVIYLGGTPLDERYLEYVGKVDENLICSICQSPFLSPLITRECDHFFCEDCFSTAYKFAIRAKTPLRCPMCRTVVQVLDVRHAPTMVLSLLDNLLVRCPKEDCAKEIPRGEIRAHLQKYCEQVKVPCPDNRCEHTILRKELNSRCMHQMVRCSACDEQIVELWLEVCL